MKVRKPEDFVKGWDLVRVLRHLPQALGKARNLGKLVKDFQDVLSLLQDYAAGRYRNVSTATIALTTAAVAYVICPFDAVPDFLPALGFGDDIAFFGATLFQIRSELGPYLEWKRSQKNKKAEPKVESETEPAAESEASRISDPQPEKGSI